MMRFYEGLVVYRWILYFFQFGNDFSPRVSIALRPRIGVCTSTWIFGRLSVACHCINEHYKMSFIRRSVFPSSLSRVRSTTTRFLWDVST